MANRTVGRPHRDLPGKMHDSYHIDSIVLVPLPSYAGYEMDGPLCVLLVLLSLGVLILIRGVKASLRSLGLSLFPDE